MAVPSRRRQRYSWMLVTGLGILVVGMELLVPNGGSVRWIFLAVGLAATLLGFWRYRSLLVRRNRGRRWRSPTLY